MGWMQSTATPARTGHETTTLTQGPPGARTMRDLVQSGDRLRSAPAPSLTLGPAAPSHARGTLVELTPPTRRRGPRARRWGRTPRRRLKLPRSSPSYRHVRSTE